MKKTIILLFAVFTSIFSISEQAFGDAGYLGSIIQNPSPAIFTTEHPTIEMASEDVIIELHSNLDNVSENSVDEREVYADVYAYFVFKNTGEKTTVSMFIPIDMPTIFVPRISMEPEKVKEMMSVFVNGDEIIIEPLYTCIYDTDFLREKGIGWNEFSKEIEVINNKEPKNGEFIHFRNYDFVSTKELSGSTEPYYSASALSASWTVSFDEGEIKVVECVYSCAFTSDYSFNTFRFAYPLFTGSSWKNSIGCGRIVVVPSDSFRWSDIKYWAGIYLPEPQVLENYCYKLSERFDGDINNIRSFLYSYDGRIFGKAIVWEFENLEPVVSRLSWLSYYPDIAVSREIMFTPDEGDNGSNNSDSNIRILDSVSPLIGTMVYLYVSRDFTPDTYYIASPDGIPAYEKVKNGIGINCLDILPFETSISFIEEEGEWGKVNYVKPDGERGGGVWIERKRKNDEELILPTIVLYVEQSVE
ncbi:MAG: hypothetical protein ACUVWP_07025 [bacterium]